MSRDGHARRRAVAAVLAIAFCMVIAGMVGQGVFFLTKAYGVQESRGLIGQSGELAGSTVGRSARQVTGASPGNEWTGGKPRHQPPPVLGPPPARRPRLSPERALAALMSGTFPYRASVMRAAARHAVDPGLIFAIIASESKGDPAALSPSGAIGLMQLMPSTALELGVDPWNPEENIEGAVRYLSGLLEQFKSVDLTLVAYNAGPGFAERYRQGEVDLGAETRAFLMRIATMH